MPWANKGRLATKIIMQMNLAYCMDLLMLDTPNDLSKVMTLAAMVKIADNAS